MSNKRKSSGKDPRDWNITTYKTDAGTVMYTGHARVTGAPYESESHDTVAAARKFRDDATARIKNQLMRHEDPREFLKEELQFTITEFMKIPSDDGGPDNKKQPEHYRTIQNHVKNVTNGQLNKQWCRDFWKYMSQTNTQRHTPYKAATVAKFFGLINTAYLRRSEQLRAGITEAPCTTKVLPKGFDTRRVRRFEPGEEEQLLEAIRAAPNSLAWLSVVKFTLATGARLQELALARWSDFAYYRGKLYWRILDETCKTGARNVPLSPAAHEGLDGFRMLKTRGESRLLWQYKNPDSVSATFRSIRAKAGLENFTFHDLRHEAISSLVAERWWMSYAAIGEMVGHSTADITDRYKHLRLGELLQAFEGPASWQAGEEPGAARQLSPLRDAKVIDIGRPTEHEPEQRAQIAAKQAPSREARQEPRRLALAA